MARLVPKGYGPGLRTDGVIGGGILRRLGGAKAGPGKADAALAKAKADRQAEQNSPTRRIGKGL